MNADPFLKLAKRYYDTPLPSSYTGATSFKRELSAAKVPYKSDSVNEWLSGQESYTLHKPIVSKFLRRTTTVSGIGQQLQADLIDVHRHSSENDGIKFLLTVIDVFSKKAWVAPLKNKSGLEVSKALAPILLESKPGYLQTDKGKEFYNSEVKKVLNSMGVTHFSSENETIKASVVERFNRSLRASLHRSFTHHGNERFVETLQDVVRSYNARHNSAIGMTPNSVNVENSEEVWLRLNNQEKAFENSGPQLKAGDPVRITKARVTFQRGYTPNWSKEIFYVESLLPTTPTTYRLRDWAKEPVVGTFYAKELQKVKEPNVYDIEEIVERKKIRGKKMVLVKWTGYPPEFNQWIPEADVVDK